MNTTKTNTIQSIYPGLRYDDAKSAIAWLKSALGFEEHEVCIGDNDSIAHAELKLGGNLIMLGSARPDGLANSPRSLGGVTGAIYIAFDSSAEVDSIFTRATAAGAEVVRELCDTDYGSHEFSVRDPEGYVWSFGTYRPQAD